MVPHIIPHRVGRNGGKRGQVVPLSGDLSYLSGLPGPCPVVVILKSVGEKSSREFFKAELF
jgi:hypothetical protein